MFKIKNGVYCFVSKVTGVEWVAYSLWSALHLYAHANKVSLTEAVLTYERS